jgi:hypothetical protein
VKRAHSLRLYRAAASKQQCQQLKPTKMVPMNTPTTIVAYRSQPKCGCHRAAHLLAATNASQRWKAKSNRVPRHLEQQSPVRCPSLLRFEPHSLPNWRQPILTKPSTVTEFASCSATYVTTTTLPIITQMDLDKIINCTSGYDDLRVVNATNPSRYHAW